MHWYLPSALLENPMHRDQFGHAREGHALQVRCSECFDYAEQMTVYPGEVNRIADIPIVSPGDTANTLVFKCAVFGSLKRTHGQRCGEMNTFIVGLPQRVQSGRTLPEPLVIALLETHVRVIRQIAEIARAGY